MTNLTGEALKTEVSPRQAYLEAKPFAHCVIDDFAPAEELRAILSEWPAREKMYYKECPTSIKASLQKWEEFGPKTWKFIRKLNSPQFIKLLEDLTGIEGLKADDSLQGGGLHEIPPGGFLNMHVDFNWHKKLGRRRVNLLLYLNEGWEWNGDLILGDGENQKVIAPIFNRCVIFSTTETSWHGHPEQLKAPVSRKSIALYYYKDEPEPEFVHSTIYRDA